MADIDVMAPYVLTKPVGAGPWPAPTERSRTWTVEFAFVAYLAAIGLAGVGEIVLAAFGAAHELVAASALWVELSFMAALIPLWRSGRLRSWADLGVRRVPAARSVGLAALALVAYVLFSAFWSPHTGVRGPRNFTGLSEYGPIAVAAAGLAACVGAPVAEEIFFRGFLYRSFRNRLSIAPACMASSILFALIHTQYTPSGRIIIFVFGVIMCLLYERTRSLLPGIAVHSLVDGTAFEFALTGRALIVPSLYMLLAAALLLRSGVKSLVAVVRRRRSGAAAPAAEKWRAATSVGAATPEGQLSLFDSERAIRQPPPLAAVDAPSASGSRRMLAVASLLGLVALAALAVMFVGVHRRPGSSCVAGVTTQCSATWASGEYAESGAERGAMRADGEAKSLARLAFSVAEKYALNHFGSYERITPLLLHREDDAIRISHGRRRPHVSEAMEHETGRGFLVSVTAPTAHVFTIAREADGSIKRTCTPERKPGFEAGGCQNGTW